MRGRIILAVVATTLFATGIFGGARVGRNTALSAGAAAVTPQPLTENVRRGLAWLVRTQHPNGGWSQGEESSNMGNGMVQLKDKPNVADTCMATMALMRAGNTPGSGEYARAVQKALEFIMSEVENSDRDSLSVTSVQGTRVQSKLGPYIDTFLTATLLSDAKGRMPEEAGNRRLIAALDKVMDKIERNQRPDGTWDSAGWAPVLSQSMGAKALNRAAKVGAKVSEASRKKAETYARGQFDKN